MKQNNLTMVRLHTSTMSIAIITMTILFVAGVRQVQGNSFAHFKFLEEIGLKLDLLYFYFNENVKFWITLEAEIF